MQNRRIYHFPQGPSVVTGLTNKGQFVAFRQDEEHPRGYGHTVMAAIADLNEALAVEGSIYEREAETEVLPPSNIHPVSLKSVERV